MHVLAALADAPTAVLAIAAILLGLFVLARGQRGEDGDEEAASSLLRVPVVVPVAARAAQTGDGADEGEAGEGLPRGGGGPRRPPGRSPALCRGARGRPPRCRPPSPRRRSTSPPRRASH